MKPRPRQRSNLDSRGSTRNAKTLIRGFGVVRILTPESQREVFSVLDKKGVPNSLLQRRPPLHATIIGFVGMSRREQASFGAGFDVARLERKLEIGVQPECPRKSLAVKLGEVANLGNFLYCKVEDDQLSLEQLQLAGQVALRGIAPARIDKKIIPTHMGIGFATGPVEEIRERVDAALIGQHIALQKWTVYPEKYA